MNKTIPKPIYNIGSGLPKLRRLPRSDRHIVEIVVRLFREIVLVLQEFEGIMDDEELT